MIYSICDTFNTCQPIIDHVRERKRENVWFFVQRFSKINPRRNHDFDSYENTIYAFADQAFNKQCLRLPWNSAVEFPYDSYFFYLPLSFSLPIARYFLVAIKGRREIFFIGNFFIGRNKCCEQESRDISHFNIGEITSVSFLRVILINLLQQIDLRKNCIYI